MSRVYVGNLNSRISERDLEDEFRAFGVLRSVWVARRPPGYGFGKFDDRRDALDAIRYIDGGIAKSRIRGYVVKKLLELILKELFAFRFVQASAICVCLCFFL